MQEKLSQEECNKALLEMNAEFGKSDADGAKIKKLLMQLFPYFKVMKIFY